MTPFCRLPGFIYLFSSSSCSGEHLGMTPGPLQAIALLRLFWSCKLAGWPGLVWNGGWHAAIGRSAPLQKGNGGNESTPGWMGLHHALQLIFPRSSLGTEQTQLSDLMSFLP